MENFCKVKNKDLVVTHMKMGLILKVIGTTESNLE